MLRLRTFGGLTLARGTEDLTGAVTQRRRLALLALLAVAGSVMQKDVRLVALTGLGWIGAAALTWALFFARRAR